MKKEILALLQAKFEGMRKDGLLALAGALSLQVATKEEASKLVDALDKENVEDFIKDYRSEVDREVTESKKKIEENLKKKNKQKVDPKSREEGEDESEESKEGEGGDPMSMEDRIAQAVAKAVKPFQEAVEVMASEKTKRSRASILKSKLEGCKSDVFKNNTLKHFDRLSFKDEDDFETYISELETDIAEANQAVASQGMLGLTPLSSSGGNSDGVSKAVQEYLKSQGGEDTKFSGKELNI